MKKPNIKYVYGDYDSPSLFLVNGLHLDVDEIKDNYEEMIDALIEAYRYMDDGDGFVRENIKQSLKNAGCTE